MVKRKNDKAASKLRNDFRISNGPVASLDEESGESDLDEAMILPRLYTEKIFFAIARDSHTIFASWSIDWPAIFAEGEPVNREVHVRTYKADGTQERGAAVEPMSGSCYLPVSQPGENYRVEIGYYRPKDVWMSVATSDDVVVPPDNVAANSDVDLATIPFHLSFQRLIDLFRTTNRGVLTKIVSRLQRRAVSDEKRDLLSPEEWAILRAMDLSLDDIAVAQRAFKDRVATEKLRRRAEAILGFRVTSPSHGFGESSWS